MLSEGFRELKSNDEHIDIIKSMGFGRLLDIECSKMPRDILLALSNKFDPVTRQLTVGRWSGVLTTYEVVDILGLHAGPRNVPLTNDGELGPDEDKVSTLSLTELRELLGICGYGSIFRKVLLAYVLTCFLCPRPSVRLALLNKFIF